MYRRWGSRWTDRRDNCAPWCTTRRSSCRKHQCSCTTHMNGEKGQIHQISHEPSPSQLDRSQSSGSSRRSRHRCTRRSHRGFHLLPKEEKWERGGRAYERSVTKAGLVSGDSETSLEAVVSMEREGMRQGESELRMWRIQCLYLRISLWDEEIGGRVLATNDCSLVIKGDELIKRDSWQGQNTSPFFDASYS